MDYELDSEVYGNYMKVEKKLNSKDNIKIISGLFRLEVLIQSL